MRHRSLFVFVSLNTFGLYYACFWGGKDNPLPQGPGKSDHWPPPPGMSRADYEAWRKKYFDELKKRFNNSGAGSHWFLQSTGDGPPPWAIFPGKSFKQELCFQPPDRGIHCVAHYEYRYAFNPDQGKCQRFIYNGCGGNSNRFLSEKRCMQVCLGAGEPSCKGKPDNELHNYMEWNDIPKITINL